MLTQVDGRGETLVIPSLERHGSRSAQLIQLEAQLSNLYAIRRTIVAGEVPPVAHAHTRRGATSSRSWFIAGAAMAIAWALLTLGAWIAHGELIVMASPVADVVRATR
jgi:hypothetical protein